MCLFVILTKELHLEEYSACRACKLVTPLVDLFVEQELHTESGSILNLVVVI